MAVCRHCGRRKATKGRGLCAACYWRPDVRSRYPVRTRWQPRPEPTEAELDAVIAEQMKALPTWWAAHEAELRRMQPGPEPYRPRVYRLVRDC